MKPHDLLQFRLSNQRIAPPIPDQPEKVAAWLGAMQAQDYSQVKWAVGLRGRKLTRSGVEKAVAEGRLVRTWLNRGTLHLAAAADVRWMLALLSPRLIAGSARRSRQLELDESTYRRSQAILAKALAGGQQLTRAEVMAVLSRSGVNTTGQRGYHLLRRAGQEGLICFGPEQDGQQTFVLLDEWLDEGQTMAGDEVLAELAGRYFSSHGPATVADFTWWSGLAAAESRRAMELIRQGMERQVLDGVEYCWRQPVAETGQKDETAAVFLLPGYDEYFLGYQERGFILDPGQNSRLISRNGVFYPMLVINGRVVGSWKAVERRGGVTITVTSFEPLTAAGAQGLAAAAERYSAFLGRPVTLA